MELRDYKETLISSEHGKFVIFRNNLNEFWIFYHGTNLGAGSLKALSSNLGLNIVHSILNN
jgi:hypothetical protein